MLVPYSLQDALNKSSGMCLDSSVPYNSQVYHIPSILAAALVVLLWYLSTIETRIHVLIFLRKGMGHHTRYRSGVNLVVSGSQCSQDPVACLSNLVF